MTYTTITMPVEHLPVLIEKLQSSVLPIGMRYGGGLQLQIRFAISSTHQNTDGSASLLVASADYSPRVTVQSGSVDTWLSNSLPAGAKASS